MALAPATPYDRFLTHLKTHRIWDSATAIRQALTSPATMTSTEKLARIDRLKTWLDAFRPLSPNIVAELKALYDVRFTYNSNAIEGNTLTQSETQLVLEKGITIGGKSLTEHLEVVGHKEAIDYIETLAQQSSPIGEWEIRQIHGLILRKIAPEEAGRYRQLDVRAAGTDYIYPPHYALTELMSAFVDWLSPGPTQTVPTQTGPTQTGQTQHPVSFAAEAHLRFVSIHPFRDGNGRTGRLLMNLLLLRAGYPIVVISNELRQAYIEALIVAQQSESSTEKTNLSPLLNLILDATEASLIEILRVVATAGDSRGKGMAFYEEMLEVLG